VEFHERLAALRASATQPLVGGSPAETEAIERFKRFFADFSPSKIAVLLDQTYAADVWFNDTLKTIRGREALREYLRHSAEAVEACTVVVDEVTATGNGEYLARWTMTIRFKRFKKGQDTVTIGISMLRFNAKGLVELHQDFWDATQGIFDHVPVIGWAIGKIKQRL
jgi:hypothetical protein